MNTFFEDNLPKYKKQIVSIIGKSDIKPGTIIPNFNMNYDVYSLDWMYFIVHLNDMQCLKIEDNGCLSITNAGADWLKTS